MIVERVYFSRPVKNGWFHTRSRDVVSPNFLKIDSSIFRLFADIEIYF